MRILFTGASSFTGHWFVHALAEAGHAVTVTMQRATAADYEGVRRTRVDLVAERASIAFGTSFGDDAFLDLIRSGGPWDVLCHHAADVTDYKSAEFDIVGAVERNTRRARTVMRTLIEHGCHRLVQTGSIFEHGEGAGSQNLPAFSPYGVSKALSGQIMEYYASVLGLGFGKFVIPNPFGPYEEPRFTNYLMKSWFAGDTPQIQTPDYVRDNIHVSLLAKAYAQFVNDVARAEGMQRINPSGYIERQGEFARRIARAMQDRLGLECALEFAHQTEFTEPRIRLNTTVLDHEALDWNESSAWDEFASYYRSLYGSMTPA